MTSSQAAEGVMYLTVKRDEYYRQKLRAVKLTASVPRVTEAGDVVIKVLVRVPSSAFDPLGAGLLEVGEDAIVTQAEVTT